MNKVDILERHSKANKGGHEIPSRVYHLRGWGCSWEEIAKALKITPSQAHYGWLKATGQIHLIRY